MFARDRRARTVISRFPPWYVCLDFFNEIRRRPSLLYALVAAQSFVAAICVFLIARVTREHLLSGVFALLALSVILVFSTQHLAQRHWLEQNSLDPLRDHEARTRALNKALDPYAVKHEVLIEICGFVDRLPAGDPLHQVVCERLVELRNLFAASYAPLTAFQQALIERRGETEEEYQTRTRWSLECHEYEAIMCVLQGG